MKIAMIVLVPLTAWLLATVVSHSEELAARPERDEIAADVKQAEKERHAIDKKVERLDERTQAIQRSLDQQADALDKQDQKLDQILERVAR